MRTYNKLVRDKIPGIIAAGGQTARTRQLNREEYVQELRTKLREECEEYFQADNEADALEELADLVEVILALAETHHADAKTLEQIRSRKAAERGGFAKGIYLMDVRES